jgi:molecular chaperone Hsp33
LPGLIRALAGGSTVRLVAVEAKVAAEEARVRHGLHLHAAVACAEGMLATILLSAHIKGDERIALQLQGERPRCAFMGEIDAEGHVRARFTPSEIPAGNIDGILLAIKSNAHQELYRGMTEVKNLPLEAAFAAHLTESQQADVLLRFAARANEAGEIELAAGFLIERLPPDPSLPSLSHEEFEATYGQLRADDLEDVMTGLMFGKLLGDPIELLETRDVEWKCRCSQEKVEAMLFALGPQELSEMIAEGGSEVTCHFCNTAWKVSAQRLTELAGT